MSILIKHLKLSNEVSKSSLIKKKKFEGYDDDLYPNKY